MEAKDTVISNDDIDGTRFRVLDELEKKAKVNWWDICKAVEGISGKQASMDAEQFLIDITNTTGVEVAKAQSEISFKAGQEAEREVIRYVALNYPTRTAMQIIDNLDGLRPRGGQCTDNTTYKYDGEEYTR